jgi:hypothetical protein
MRVRSDVVVACCSLARGRAVRARRLPAVLRQSCSVFVSGSSGPWRWLRSGRVLPAPAAGSGCAPFRYALALERTRSSSRASAAVGCDTIADPSRPAASCVSASRRYSNHEIITRRPHAHGRPTVRAPRPRDVSVSRKTYSRQMSDELTQPCYRTVRARADAGEDRAAGVGTITLVCPYGARDRTCAARCARVGEYR